VRWFSFYAIDGDGRRDLLARITCRSDDHAMDRTSASIWPGAQVYEGKRLVGVLPGRPGDDPEARCILSRDLGAHR